METSAFLLAQSGQKLKYGIFTLLIKIHPTSHFSMRVTGAQDYHDILGLILKLV